MASDSFVQRLHPRWWSLILVALIVSIATLTAMLFSGTLKTYVPVTLTSDRAGLVMESGGKVKMRGVQVGRVSQIVGGRSPVSLQLQIDPDQIRYIPANVQARIRATTAFGAKYVDLIYPSDPSTKRLAAGQTIKSENVSTEVNTVFQNLVGVLRQIDPAKLNAVLSALADALRGQGLTIGEATTDANQVLLAINPRAETIRADWQALKGFSDTYALAAQDILKVLDAASTTSTTISSNAAALDALLTSVVGFSRSGVDLLGASKDNLVNTVSVLEPTTGLLLKYNPELTCMLVGSKWLLDHDGYAAAGGNGRTLLVDAAVLLGDDPYRYPDNLPIVGAKGGPGGRPGCGSLPIVDNNWPVRYVVTNTGWGTGLDVRPNPGIGFPGYANYFPATRAVPEPPSIRNPGGPAPGPIPYPGAPPYGAQLYAPDGTPLYPGLPPAPPPGAPREPAPPPPGSEPFVVPHPAQMQPTPMPPIPPTVVPSP
ncbi:MCE family protein [Mycobacterium sp.]|jgi:phospholipid/cholesterol/gamma-HCH transport system substrate-binding protein|uniref:MCE family protein n=1 Tax=Mycobacterium sp. TaxID=1785 RepID=UPI003342218D|nr:virulence factor Mce family protein [Mycobacterium sp.]